MQSVVMKFVLSGLYCLVTSVIFAQTPKETVNTFFEALNSKNAEQIEVLMADDLKLHSLSISTESKLSSTDKETFINSIKNIGPEVTIEERIFDVESLENNRIATVWVPYQFYVNGNFSHEGINVFTMVKIEEVWTITSITDTRVRK